MYFIKMYHDYIGEEEYNIIKDDILCAIFYDLEDAQEYVDFKNKDLALEHLNLANLIFRKTDVKNSTQEIADIIKEFYDEIRNRP